MQLVEPIHIGHLIQTELKEQRRSAAWLAEELNCNRANVYNIFNRRTIDTELLERISLILHRNFFELMAREISNEERHQKDVV